ncbi:MULTISPECIES: GTP 3',8-cyclase MoaA [unclassified Cryobacterium]|uniref:GTP 3',8-cyclase MoaA n=1 Tax=unclassified Cryobacterium TaxID=2649013 RepID=UPI002AB3D7A3|nr:MULTISPECIES: GTP 3',8-cyclase MoaA [unclassified Cryobacterium]MDY7543506.1 GTP 3',8-cyclase MoaA [Cryobacterium sp. 5B3]MEA9999737.1 GTP 3',8-cyclase MoaA [Cryobacterium sp. RTS3]MEB0266235.1 GTP 3',8-cyclase MoaA [Cryobacterium sp. 10I5]MEB0273136.1 GTP 3',8-cyclase MoaA [Cryobacterium sp. 5B3]
MTGNPTLTDTRGRPLHDLRISVTDRCNFRCVYCMPKEVFGRDFAFMERDELLTFEEITRLARVSVAHWVGKIRLTGGEPLLRRGLEDLVAQLSALRTPDGRPIDIALTTNGSALAVKAQALKDAGLRRVTVSLDSLDDATFRAMNDVNFPVAKVLHGIEVASNVGLGPVKVNMVVKRGQNDGDIVAMARHFQGTPVILRFIEFMDVGSSNGWEMGAVVPSSEVIARIGAELPLEEVAPNYTGETSARWRYRDGSGEIGVISSVTQSFCSTCSRARVSTDGKLFTCLFATEGHDLRALLRGGATDDELSAAMASIWRERTDRYSDLRSAKTRELRASGKKKIEMSYIGG